MFIPTTGRTLLARTDSDGEYELMFLERVRGANLGCRKVVITTYHEDELEEMISASSEPVIEQTPAKYNSKTTLWGVMAENSEFDFSLDWK